MKNKKINTYTSHCEVNNEDTFNILDRIIGFINNCDNKTAIVLGVFGVIITVIFTTDGIGNIFEIINSTMTKISFFSIFFLILWITSLGLFIIGLCKLITVLVAKIETADMRQIDLDLDSRIFFGTIAKNKNYKTYKEKLLSMDNDCFQNDIISQIYINSLICKKKFKNYNKGLLLAIIGFLCFMIIWIIGKIYLK